MKRLCDGDVKIVRETLPKTVKNRKNWTRQFHIFAVVTTILKL